jgi:hypothetical protein
VFEVEAVADAAQLDVEVPLHELEGHFLAALGIRQVHFAKAAPAEAAPDRVSGDRPVPVSVSQFHDASPPRKRGQVRGRWGLGNYFVAGRQLLGAVGGKK